MNVTLRMGAQNALTDERFEWYLWNWEQWRLGEGIFQGNESYGTGFGSRASGGIGATQSKDFDAMYTNSCRVMAEAVEGIVDSLPSREHDAVYVKHLHMAPGFLFKGGRAGLEDAYAAALVYIRRELDRRGFW